MGVSGGLNEADTAFLAGGGDLGALMRTMDWSSTSLGDPGQWPRSLKTVVRIMLTSRQPIWIGWGPELLYLYNDPYKSIIGGKHPQALGQPTSVVWKEIWADIEPLLASAMSGDGTFVENQLLIMERNGYPEETYYTFSYSPIPGDDGQPAGIICANSDETRRVFSERQLALLRDMAAGTRDAETVEAAVRRGVAAMTTQLRDITFSMVLLRTTAQPALTLAGQCEATRGGGLSAFFLAPDRIRDAEQVLASRRPAVIDLPAGTPWPAGAWHVPSTKAMLLPLPASSDAAHEGVLVVGLNPFRLDDEAYRDFLGLVAKQVGSAVASAEAFESAKRRAEELAELDRAKTLFFSNVSHEFRTPLTLMQGPIADVVSDPDLAPHLRERLELAERNALRLSKLVNALLEFSRIEAGRLQSVFRPTDLSLLTAELASNFRSAMERAGLEFTVDCELLPAPVYVDVEQWERIVLNLLSNALKFTLEGSVTLRLRARDEHEVVMEVSDTGVGVPEDEVGRLFERFHRVQGTHGRTHEGSGIGLALVQELVRLHGGSISARSQLGQGTTFTIRLPFGKSHLPQDQLGAKAGSAAAGSADAFVQEALRWLPDAKQEPEAVGSSDLLPMGMRYRATVGARVLVADDNADLRLYLERLLQPYYEVETVADGELALEAMRRARPALLITDVMMPRLDGFGVLAAVRDDPQLRGIPVVMLSARAGEEARMEGLEAGADDYLLKPFTARELLARVSAIIELDRVRRAGEERLKLFLAGGQMFTWEIDLTANRVNYSANSTDVLGATASTADEALADVHPDDREHHREVLQRSARTGESFTDEIRFVRPTDGQLRWLLVRGTCLMEAGRPVRLSGLSFDITERRAAEIALRESDKRKDEFLAMLAHELRNPLAPIRNAVEILGRGGAANTISERAVSIIDRQATQLTRLVDDLLDVSRITTGRIQLSMQPVDLATIVAAAVEAADASLRERSHDLKLTAGTAMTVMGDAARLQQCVVNLLTNAAKYTEPGGRICVSVRRQAEEGVISVTDNGMGIPPEFLASVFELFVQSERTLDRSQGGLGIGLSVVQRLIAMHGGRVSADSPGLGQGSTFEIRLPLINSKALVEKPSADLPSGQPLRVLVVDDNQDAADSLAMMLNMAGHEVRTLYAAREAIDLAREWRPHAMLLDIGLPDIDGYALARQLRKEPALRSTRLAAITGYGQPADRARSREAGFNDHLVKPVDLDRVLEVLQRAAS